ncbi:MAG: glycyl-radical enzyme activating protein [Bacteroidota bacterium]|nr:glycyl-radical enzyme activating protein [Bacteroidota bacterium]
MSELSGTIFNIQKFSINDGPGIRTTVFFKGCPLNCLWCHNPESKKLEPEKMSAPLYKHLFSFNSDPDQVGFNVSSSLLMKEILKDYLFYEESGGGVTFSGGEPLMQSQFLLELLRQCKAKDIHTAVDTCGFAPYENLLKVSEFTDLFLFDLKIIDDVDHIKYTGVSNKLIHENLKKLCDLSCNINIRIPLIPQITDTQKNLEAAIELISDLNIKDVTLLPFNEIAISKYKKLGLGYDMNCLSSQKDEILDEVCQKFRCHGLQVKIRG